MGQARQAVLEYLAGVGPEEPGPREFARTAAASLELVARARGYERLNDVPESRLVHAVGLWCALEVTNIRVSDPPVAAYLQQRVEEHLTPDEEDEGDFEEQAPEAPARTRQYAVGKVIRREDRRRSSVSPDRQAAQQAAGLSELLAGIGGSSWYDDATGDTVLAWRGAEMVRLNSRRVPPASWAQARFGQFVTRVMEYNGLVRGLEENRGLGTAGLRQLLRENLPIDVLVAEARVAGAEVAQAGGFTTKKYSFSHPLMGQFLEVTVPRGQNHVIDVAFDSPDTFKPLSFLVGFVQKTNGVI